MGKRQKRIKSKSIQQKNLQLCVPVTEPGDSQRPGGRGGGNRQANPAGTPSQGGLLGDSVKGSEV